MKAGWMDYLAEAFQSYRRKTMRKFWMVWAEHGGPMTHQHYTEQSARSEAERLARISPNTNFWVMEATIACRKSDVSWHRPDTGDEIPF